MLEIINKNNDPYFNLALEEYIFKNLDIDSLFVIWRNSPVVVIGKNQNALDEVNQEFLQENKIDLVRRISGGGAVYHDLGNLNFTFIAPTGRGLAFDFVRFTRPIIKTLERIGIKARHDGRNDITIAGKKFSGNAQFRYGKKVMHHGTLLYDVNLENMVKALQVSSEKIGAKGIKSVRSRVTNISEHLSEKLSVDEFKALLVENLKAETNIKQTWELTSDDLAQITNLCNNKYRSWDWNYGKSPDYNIKRQKRFPWGSIEIRFKVSQNIIKDCKIYGDFFAVQDISLLEGRFMGINYNKQSLGKLMNKINIRDYLPNADGEEILRFLTAEWEHN